ncbi:DUF6049 family protein [Kribbella sp. NPDC051952]|uniref:DUF6049 family protein n=1 Tax=Kribbella sp. NPDC051952 TaxID=3154851 RepID=UPI0034217C08
MFRRRLRLSAVVSAGLVLAAAAATLGSPSADAAPTDDPVVQVTIDSFGPIAPKVGDAVTIKGTVRNTSQVTFAKPQALACIARSRLSTSTQIAAVGTEQNVPMNDRDSCSRLTTADSGAFQELGDSFAPNAALPFSLTIPWKEWRIGAETGVYVVGVQFRGQPPDQDRITAGRARTLMPVQGEQPLSRKVNTALVIPLRHRPTLLGGDRFTNESLAESMAPTGDLGKLLALGNQRRVTWLVDPAMLHEAQRMRDGYRVGEGEKTTPGTGRAVVAAWLKEFDASRASGSQVVLLPYGDPDLAGLWDSGEPLKNMVWDARKATEQFILPPGFTNGLWLEGGAAASRYLAAASTGYSVRPDDLNLVSSASWPPAERPGLTATSPVYDVRTPEGPSSSVRTVVADAALTSGGPDSDTTDNPIQVRQRFAAETALLAATGKGVPSVVAVPPRDWDSTGRATAALAGSLSSLPWIAAGTVAQVAPLGIKAPAIKAPTAPRTNSTMIPGQLDGIQQLNQSITTLKDLLVDPAENLPEIMPQSLLRAASTSWRGFPDEAQRFTSVEVGSVNVQLSKVHLVNNVSNGERKEIKVNLAGSKGTFPLTIANDTDWSVRVGVQVSPLNRTDLRIETQQTRILAPKQKYTPRIVASAEQNGVIRANAQVITASGRPVGRSEELLIQATQYGSVGWILVGAACALLFGTSFVRIFRRIRTERRNPSDPDPAGPTSDALHPEPLEPPEPVDPPSAGIPAGESLKEGVGSKDG